MRRLKFPRLSLAAVAVLDGTVETLEATKDAITAAAPVPGLSIALNVVIELLKRIQGARSNCDALLTLCQEATFLVNTLEGLAKTIRSGVEKYPTGSSQRAQAQERVCSYSSKLHGRVMKLARDLRAICVQTDKLSQRSYFERFLHSARDTEAITGMKDAMAAACRCFQMEGNIAIEVLVAEMLDLAKAAEEERILNSIPRADGAHYLSAANTMKARLQTGTREQIFTRLEEWEERQFSDHYTRIPVFVLVGEAGTGKSTIASEFAKRLQRRDRLGASFFFTRGVQELNSPSKVFSTIASQLARSQSALRPHIVDAAREHLKTAALQQLECEFEDLIRRPLSAISSEPHPPIFVILDALDECTEEGQKLVPILLRLLLSAAAKPGSHLRVFLTSRPEPHYIHRVFTTPDMKPHVVTVSIQEFRSSVDADIRQFIRTRFYENYTSKMWSQTDPSILDRLVEKSDGLFIYARTALDFILGDADDPLFIIQERYNLLLTIERESTGLDLIDELYLTVLLSVFPPRQQYAKMQERLTQVLEYLVTLQDPQGVSPMTLAKLTGMDPAESVPILNKLRSVVLFERDNVDAPFRIIHATFREFLVDRSGSGEVFYVSRKQVEQVHGRLADSCTTRVMLSFLDERLPCGTGSPAMLYGLVTFRNLPPSPDSPHVKYACTYLHHHRSHGPQVLPDILPQDPWNGRPGEIDDILSLIPTIALHMSSDRSWDIGSSCDILTVVTQRLQRSLPAGNEFEDSLSRMQRIILVFKDHPERSTEIVCMMLSLVLDIRAVVNCAVEKAPPRDPVAIRTGAVLNEHQVQELTATLKLEEGFAALRVNYMQELKGALIKAHTNFHRAIVAAKLTPGHEYEDEYWETYWR